MSLCRLDQIHSIPTIEDFLKAPVHPLRKKGGRRLKGMREYGRDCPVVSVITIVRNDEKMLPEAIVSVLNQTYHNIEYIVIDGASTDGTLDVIERFEDRIDLWISEPDSGTSDAFNKAVSMASGDFIFWLASDDWIEADFINTAVRTLLESGGDFVFGDMLMYKPGDPALLCKGRQDYAESIMSGCPFFNFPTMVIKKDAFHRIKLIDMSYKYVADYEWVLRLHLSGAKGFYSESIVVHRRVGGIGERYLIRSALEHLRLLKRHGLPKKKAMMHYLYLLLRSFAGNAARVLLPLTLHKKIKRAMGKP